MEYEPATTHKVMEGIPDREALIISLELKVLRVHVLSELRMAGHTNRIDPGKWSPIIMSFQELHSLKGGKVSRSQAGEVEEENYSALIRSGLVRFLGDGGRETVDESSGKSLMLAMCFGGSHTQENNHGIYS